jgi:hypothetical protein
LLQQQWQWQWQHPVLRAAGMQLCFALRSFASLLIYSLQTMFANPRQPLKALFRGKFAR